MKSMSRRIVSLFTTLVMTFSIMSLCLCNVETKVAAAGSNVNLGATTEYRLNYNNIQYQGYIYKPQKEGKYPVVVCIAGTGGAAKYGSKFAASMNSWIKKGLIEPKIYIMPAFSSNLNAEFKGDDYKIFLEYKLGSMMDAFRTSEYGDSIDFSTPMSVLGYSMGGAASIYAGNLYPDTFVNVGSLSPGQEYYSTVEGYGWIKPSQVRFSKNSKARRLLACSKKEGSNYNTAVRNYDTLTRNKGYRFKIYRTNTGSHDWPVFMRETFVFLYYVDNNIVLTDSMLLNMGYSTT